MKYKNCKDCDHWESEDGEAGECRRYAPHAKRRMDTARTVAGWPTTHRVDWCGEFAPIREKVETTTPSS